jgi:hypothetical protein
LNLYEQQSYSRNRHKLHTSNSTRYPKFALEFPGLGDPNVYEVFPQLSICPGSNHSAGAAIHTATIDHVVCTFHDVKPVDPNNPSKGSTETLKDIPATTTKRYIDFQPLSCMDVTFSESDKIIATRGHSHSFISCRVQTSGHYIKVAPYTIAAKIPRNNWADWTNIKTGNAIMLGITLTEYATTNGWTNSFFEVEKVAPELRFAPSSASHNAFFSVSFVMLSKVRYQQFFTTDVLAIIGVIGGISVFFLYIYKGLSAMFEKAMKEDRTLERRRLVTSDSLRSSSYGGL